ncbi:uncharacterized mitochondrial protein AtMg00860-like [Vigna angularis]|uniref:uncharacterized mitochondrial protein AtMg00860-like n=1 Tax=Phaseolus angularis TaxID=3914 RepID=UPI00080A115A|nr:uncharacterized mitochondrial protein AtMg00860-like [Vigna angularis]
MVGSLSQAELMEGEIEESGLTFNEEIALNQILGDLVYRKTWEEHTRHLTQVLEVLAKQKLFANKKTWEFGKKQRRYLRHKISEGGVEMDREKITTVLEWPKPRNIKELHGFLVFTSYYRRFIRDYRRMARPLTNLLKKGMFKWPLLRAKAMQKLKEVVTPAPVLALPDFGQTF